MAALGAMVGAVMVFGMGYQLYRLRSAGRDKLPRYWVFFEKRSTRHGVSPRVRGESLKQFANRAAPIWPAGVPEEIYSAVEQQLYDPRFGASDAKHTQRASSSHWIRRLRRMKLPTVS